MHYNKEKPFIIQYRRFNDFNNNFFIKDFQKLPIKSFKDEAIPFQALWESMNLILSDKQAPTKKRMLIKHSKGKKN